VNADRPLDGPGVLHHRCRQCGALVEQPVANVVAAVGEDIDGWNLQRLHDCGNGRVGVADLIGGTADAPATPERS
jgi:hypothetical protein